MASDSLTATGDRLPTVSASQLLSTLSATPSLSTGLRALDALLCPSNPGLPPGGITEIWGPSGSGKTTFALSLARSAKTVCWLDLSFSLSRETKAITPKRIPSLPHLLSFLARPPTAALLVLDNLSAALDASFPPGKGVPAKRIAALGAVAGLLRKALATRVVGNVVVTATAGSRAGICVSSLGGGEWERAVTGRWALFRDVEGRYLGVTKMGGKRVVNEDGEVGFVVGFGIDQDGIVDPADAAGKEEVLVPTAVSPVKTAKKRKFGEVIADSESDEEYDWDDADAEGLSTAFLATEGLVDEDEDLIEISTREFHQAKADGGSSHQPSDSGITSHAPGGEIADAMATVHTLAPNTEHEVADDARD